MGEASVGRNVGRGNVVGGNDVLPLSRDESAGLVVIEQV